MRNRYLLGALLLSGCGGHSAPSSTAPRIAAPTTAEAAVRGFLLAAADSNIEQMSQLFGTEKGSAFATHQPVDYIRKLEVIQLYLRRINFTVGKIHPLDADPSKTVVEVVIDHQACLRTMPVITVQSSKSGWVVNQLDLNTAGNPTRPCRDAGGDAVKPKQ